MCVCVCARICYSVGFGKWVWVENSQLHKLNCTNWEHPLTPSRQGAAHHTAGVGPENRTHLHGMNWPRTSIQMKLIWEIRMTFSFRKYITKKPFLFYLEKIYIHFTLSFLNCTDRHSINRSDSNQRKRRTSTLLIPGTWHKVCTWCLSTQKRDANQSAEIRVNIHILYIL